MAIHGTIAINNREICAWDAQRIETHPTGRHRYQWRADIKGERFGGLLWHDYDAGAAKLASLILAAVARRL